MLVLLGVGTDLTSSACTGLLAQDSASCFHMLCHLLASNYLTEAIVELLFVKDLWLSSTDEDLPSQLRIFRHTLITLSGASLMLSLGAVSLSL